MQELKTPAPGRPKGAKTFEAAPAFALGAAVRARRLEIGVSQEDLASAAQVERSHMGKIERGEHMPNFVLLIRLAKALQLTPGQLVDQAVAFLESHASTQD